MPSSRSSKRSYPLFFISPPCTVECSQTRVTQFDFRIASLSFPVGRWMLNTPLRCCGLLLLHFKSHESRTVFVSSIAGAPLLQLVGLVTDKAIQEEHHLLLAAISLTTLPDGLARPLGPQHAMPSPILWTYPWWEMASVRGFCGLNISTRHCGRSD